MADRGSPFGSSEFRGIVDVEPFPVDDGTRFAAPLVSALHGWWKSAGGGRPPARRLFDVTDHRTLVQNLFLVERRGGDFAFRVRGEEVLRLLGGYRRVRTVSDHRPDEYRLFLSDRYSRILDTGICWGCRGTLAFWNRPDVLFQSVDCPLLDADGAPRFILGAIQALGHVGDR